MSMTDARFNDLVDELVAALPASAAALRIGYYAELVSRRAGSTTPEQLRELILTVIERALTAGRISVQTPREPGKNPWAPSTLDGPPPTVIEHLRATWAEFAADCYLAPPGGMVLEADKPRAQAWTRWHEQPTNLDAARRYWETCLAGRVVDSARIVEIFAPAARKGPGTEGARAMARAYRELSKATGEPPDYREVDPETRAALERAAVDDEDVRWVLACFADRLR